MSLIGNSFGNNYSGYPDSSSVRSSKPAGGGNPYNDLVKLSSGGDDYKQEMASFNSLFSRVKGMDGSAEDRDGQDNQVLVRTRTDTFQLQRTQNSFELSHTEVEPLPPGMMSMAGPHTVSTTYTIEADKITKTVNDNRAASSNPMVLNTLDERID